MEVKKKRVNTGFTLTTWPEKQVQINGNAAL